MLKTAFTWLVLAVACIACEPVNRWIGQDDDWIGEELAEEAIRYKTGVKIDLSPSSPE